MIKVGIFVEGQTERIFIQQFLQEYFGIHRIEIEELKYLGSKGVQYLASRKNPNADFYILIYDVSGDGNVASIVKESAERFLSSYGYSYLLALRDLYPQPRSNKRAVIEAFYNLFEGYLFRDKIKLILAIMEIEAWFLADADLFLRINPSISHEDIKRQLDIDLINDNPELYDHPTSVVNSIYGLFGESYTKSLDQSYNIASNIDYDILFGSDQILDKVSSLKYFLERIDESISGS